MNKDAVQYLEEKHIKALDGVRGLAALLVLTAHILDILFQGTSIFGLTHQVAVLFAYSGMSLFFVLSGVVMEINYGGESNPAGRGGGLVAFIIKRIARLFPLYLVLLVCYNGISALLIDPLVGITYLTLTQSWVNNMQYTFAPGLTFSSVCVVLYLCNISFGGYVAQNFALAPLWAILIWLGATQRGWKRLFESWGLRKTGEISYGIYMLQFMVMTTMVILIPGSDTLSKVSKVFGIIVLTYCLAYGSSVLIEKPARSYLRKLCN